MQHYSKRLRLQHPQSQAREEIPIKVNETGAEENVRKSKTRSEQKRKSRANVFEAVRK